MQFKDNILPNIFHFLLYLAMTCFLLRNSLADQRDVVKPGDHFPNILLTGPFCPEDKKYLGLSGQKSYSLNNTRTDFILAEVFSIYCPVCQKDAAKFNKLFTLIEGDNFINKNMKMIGIGAGNNSNEVLYFKKYYNILFPCISDPDFKIHKALKETRTPLVIIIDKRSQPYKILTILDFTKEPEKLIEDIRAEIRKIKK